MYFSYRSCISPVGIGGLRCQSSSSSVLGGVSTMDCSRFSSSVGRPMPSEGKRSIWYATASGTKGKLSCSPAATVFKRSKSDF